MYASFVNFLCNIFVILSWMIDIEQQGIQKWSLNTVSIMPSIINSYSASHDN